MNYTTRATLVPIRHIFTELGSFIKLGIPSVLYTPLDIVTPTITTLSRIITPIQCFKNSRKKVTISEKEELLRIALSSQNDIFEVLEKRSDEKVQELLVIQEQLLEVISKLEDDLAVSKI